MSFVDLLRIHAGILLQKNQGNKVLINKKKFKGIQMYLALRLKLEAICHKMHYVLPMRVSHSNCFLLPAHQTPPTLLLNFQDIKTVH